MRKKLLRYRKPITKLTLALLLAASLLGVSPIATAQDQTGNGFSTPEEAITFYMQALTQGDISQLMQACAITEMSENFRFDLFTDRIELITMNAPAPSDYSFYMEINEAQFTWQILNQVKNLAYGLLATENQMTEGYSVRIDAAGTSKFMEEVDPARLAELQVMMIGLPEPHMASDERNLENWNEQAQVYGADELTERVVLFLFEGNYYYTGFTLLRYGENWKISWAASYLGNTNAMGAPQPTTEEEFQELIDID